MSKLTVDLREGFTKTAVIVSVGGREVYRADAVSTRLQVGLAKRISVEAFPGRTLVEIVLPGLGRTIRAEVETTKDAFVGVDLDQQGRETIRVQSEDFRYM